MYTYCSVDSTRLYCVCVLSFFFFNDTATTEIYTLSLHDALPISGIVGRKILDVARDEQHGVRLRGRPDDGIGRSEEHTSELQSPDHLVCRLLLEKKKYISIPLHTIVFILQVTIYIILSLLRCVYL